MSKNFGEAVDNYWAVASKLFNTSALNSTYHLLREVKELRQDLKLDGTRLEVTKEKKLEEMADVQFLLLYVMKRSGFCLEDLIKAMDKKLDIIKTREWIKLGDGTYQHVK